MGTRLASLSAAAVTTDPAPAVSEALGTGLSAAGDPVRGTEAGEAEDRVPAGVRLRPGSVRAGEPPRLLAALAAFTVWYLFASCLCEDCARGSALSGMET